MEKDMVGTYGEYFTVTRLLSWGYPATVVPGPFKYDVVVDIDGTPLRIQVKSTGKIQKSRTGNDVFRFECRTRAKSYKEKDYDIMACVAVPNYRILFLPNGSRKALERKVETFNKEQERNSWDSCLKSLGLIK